VALDVERLHLAPQPVASIVIPSIGPAAVGAALGGALPEVFGHLQALGVAPVGPPFARYHPGEAGTFDLEAGLPVAGGVAGRGVVRSGELPGGEAITVIHVGPYERLDEGIARLAAWRAEHGRAAGGAHWAIFLDDPTEVPPDRVRTRLVEPLAR
jgi:effector-binding domain-containing protein